MSDRPNKPIISREDYTHSEKAKLAIKIAADLTDKPIIVDEKLLETQEIKMESIELSHWYGDNQVLSGISM
ncbi:MAG: hypothetical protein ACFFDW_00735, partial [Candidatus Thorarchaeota archaeon]